MTHFTHTRFASLVLAIGFFLACSPSKPSIDSYIENSEYTQALTSIDKALEANPNQPDLLLKKGTIHLKVAQSLSVDERLESYQAAVQAFNEAMELGITEEQKTSVKEDLTRTWEEEFSTGTKLYEGDKTEEGMALAAAHFNNAIALQPNRSNAYLSLSVVQYQANMLDEAINTLNRAKSVLDPVPQQVYENLGFLYLQAGDTEQSVFYYELANTEISENKNIAFGLVNTYILNGQTEKAADLLAKLAERFPKDARIHNVYGTQLFEIASGILDDLAKAYADSNISLIDQIKFEAEGVGEQAEDALITAYQLDDTNKEYIESLAVFYNNMAGNYLKLTEISFPEDQETFSSKAKILLDFAIQYYEKLASFEPDNNQVNTTIGVLKQLQKTRFGNQ